MVKAYDRVKNANNGSDNFIKTPYWTNEIEDDFERWWPGYGANTLEELVALQLESEVGISFKSLDGSVCCTLAHQPSKEAGLPYLLTGWSEGPHEALAVALYKLEVMMKGVWVAPELPAAPRRR